MDFFKNFAEQIPGADVQLTIKEKNGTFAVLILPNLGTKKSIKPLEVNGSAAELDQDFFKLITTPLQQASAVVSNAKEFAESVQAAAKPEPQKKVDKPKKDHKPSRPASKKKTEKTSSVKSKSKKEKKIKPEKEVVVDPTGPEELTAF